MSPDPPSDRQSKRIKGWTTTLVVFTSIVLLGIPVRVIQLQVAPSDSLAAALTHNVSHSVPLVRRGDLLDRRGRLVATTTLGWRAFIDPQESDDPTMLGIRLQDSIGLDALDVDRALSGRLHRRYIPISGLLEDWQIRKLRAQPISGVALETLPVRRYPTGTDGGSIVGMVGFEHDGLSGLEHTMEWQLSPQHGSLKVVRDAGRRAIWIPAGGFDPGHDGASIRLSIDLEVQRMAESRLPKQYASTAQWAGVL